MTPEYKAVWDEFKARVDEAVDDVTWSEWNEFRMSGEIIRMVEIGAVTRGQSRKWQRMDFAESEKFNAADLLAAWLAEIEMQILRMPTAMSGHAKKPADA